MSNQYIVIDFDIPENPLVHYSEKEAFSDYQKIFPQILADRCAIWNEDDFDSTNGLAIKLDKTNLSDYIDNICSILRLDGNGSKSKFAQILKVIYVAEYGFDIELLSSLNLIFLMGFGTIDKLNWFGSSDEMYNIKNGTQQLTDKLEKLLFESGLCEIHFNSPVSKIKKMDNSYQLTVNNINTNYSYLIMTIPFQVYDMIDYSEAHFSPLKKYIINNSKLGFTTKLHVQFKEKFWNKQHSGLIYVTNQNDSIKLQTVYDSSANHDETTGILVNYVGGNYAKIFGENELINKSILDNFVDQLKIVYPEIDIKSLVLDFDYINWFQHKWSKGAYSGYIKGQCAGGNDPFDENGSCYSKKNNVSFAGSEIIPEQNCYFCGDACTIESQGYMNGAVFTANIVSNEIINKIYKKDIIHDI